MSYERFYWDQIKSRVKRLSKEFNENESISFLRLVTSLVTGIDPSEVDEYITDGAGDLGADAIYFDINDEDRRVKLFVIQTKYNKTACENNIFNKRIGEDVINKFKNIFDFFSSEISMGVNNTLKEKKEEYDSLIEDGYVLDEVIFISSNLGIGPSESTMIIFNRWRESHPMRDKIKYEHLGLKDIFKKIELIETPTVSDEVQLYGRYFEYSTPDIKGLISTISATELINLYNKFGDKLFQQNVRYFLGENAINKKIIKSAKDPSQKDKFWFLNNGITIVCEDYDKIGLQTENIKLRLNNFQIVNGAQTTRCIYEAYKEIGNVDEIKVLVKIFKADSTLSELITESTNSQNPVNKRDLRSNDEIQKLLERSLLERGYYYQRKRNQFINKPRNKIIDNFLFAQEYHSFYNDKPHDARNKKSQLFGNDEIYSSIFNENLAPEKVIFIHELYNKIINILRKLKRDLDFNVPSSIIDRSKFFVLYGCKLYYQNKDINVEDSSFFENISNLDLIDESIVKDILYIINEEAQKLIEKEDLNVAKVFQKKELVENIARRLKEVR